MREPTPIERTLHERLSGLLAEAEACFTIPVKVTLVIRTPSLDDGDVLLSNEEDLVNAQAIVEKMRHRDMLIRADELPHHG